jgi:hypothetical protein
MPNIPVNVNVNLTSVSYSNGVWSGTPTWNFVPSTAHASAGDNTITWNLHATNAGVNYSSGFPSSNAIVFKSTDNPPWSGGTPTTQDSTTVTATDNFANPSGSTSYKYTTNVTVTAPDGTTTTFTHDPEIQNDPGGILVHDVVEYV